MIKLAPELRVVAALQERLTTPDSEDWMIIPDRKVVHVTALREPVHGPTPIVAARRGSAPLVEFKQLVEELPPNHDLGCVTVIVCRDFEAAGTASLLAWLGRQARKKNFSLRSFHGPASTAEAVQIMRERLSA